MQQSPHILPMSKPEERQQNRPEGGSMTAGQRIGSRTEAIVRTGTGKDREKATVQQEERQLARN